MRMEHNERPQHLAWHETLEIHELTASQSVALMKLKLALPTVTDPELKRLYTKAIEGLTANIKDLLEFYPLAPREEDEEEDLRNQALTPFLAGDLLGLFKSSVKNYAVAITETATPELRKVLKTHINKAIDSHEEVFHYMYKKGYYPAYDLKSLLQNDVNLAKKALNK
ncbi:spore coat protein [Niallia sp. BSM11]|uniref:spore coat protein n=1 Tax=Niallia sp. BSM11 TaxID=3391576 RepID=UPI0039856B33